jgi:hypothetical protein
VPNCSLASFILLPRPDRRQPNDGRNSLRDGGRPSDAAVSAEATTIFLIAPFLPTLRSSDRCCSQLASIPCEERRPSAPNVTLCEVGQVKTWGIVRAC